MSRTLTTAVATATEAEVCSFVIFVELDFASGFVRACNANVSLDWNSYTWSGVGNLGSIQTIEEVADLEAKGVSLQLSGIPSAMISRALGEHYQGRSCKIWVAPLDPTNHTAIPDPVLVFSGRMDTMQIELGEQARISVTAESRLADWDRPRIRRFNNADQKTEYVTDSGFEFVEQMVEKEIRWGS